jgi:HK97 family phage prohead protease
VTTLHRFATIQKLAPSGAPLPDRVIVVRASDESLDRQGDVLIAKGCDHKNYDRNPIVLADHDPTSPIGTASVEVRADGVYATIQFAPEGASAKADEYCALAKAGVLGAVSVGFKPIESKPLATGGDRFEKWELLEISLVSVPANSNALIVQRSYGGKAPGMSGADRGAHASEISDCLDALSEHRAAAGSIGDQIVGVMDRALAPSDRAAKLCKAIADGDLSPSDLEHHTALTAHLNKIEDCRISAECPLREVLDGMQHHVDEAAKHASAIGGVVDGELALRRRREKEIAARKKRIDETDAKFAAMEARTERLHQIPTAPKAWRKFVDPEREVTCILTDETTMTNGYRFLLDGMDSGGFERQGGPVLVNHVGPVVARCSKLERRGKTIVAHLQFPQVGASAAADAAFDAVQSGKLRSASAGWLLHEKRDLAGAAEATRSTLREITLCEIGANKNAVVLSVGGRSVSSGAAAVRSSAAWDNPSAPRLRTWEEAGGTSAHMTQAASRFNELRLAAQYYKN